MRRVLLIVSGGVAAYKIPETVRRLRDAGCAARVILTKAGAQFVTPMTLQAVSGDQVHTDMFSLTDESRMGHIELSRSADIVLAAPASADLIAKMAAGLADDLASTTLLATDKPVVIAPAMNVRMWEHPATQANIATLKARGVTLIGPAEGDMACGEYGMGRMAEPDEIVAGVLAALESAGGAEALAGRLAGRRALVTSGPTHEPIDPARYIANRSSGKQGHAVAAALAAAGAHTTLVSGPAQLPDPAGVETVHVATAREMLAACEAALPADVCVCAAAVADWRVENAAETKIKKDAGAPPALRLAENPDILRTLARRNSARPGLVIGFAAETGDVVKNAAAKRAAKGCDWIAANDVSEGSGVFGGDDNTLHLITAEGVEDWPRMSKHAAAERLAARIAGFFEGAA
ncbi:MAG: bifunctional phosphopantothenoylcysteine decarboxylase/phosphopantothenate--cysteine ligase CoaBC [Rhodospirillales bacterium]